MVMQLFLSKHLFCPFSSGGNFHNRSVNPTSHRLIMHRSRMHGMYFNLRLPHIHNKEREHITHKKEVISRKEGTKKDT
jgi:hypothetical protein